SYSFYLICSAILVLRLSRPPRNGRSAEADRDFHAGRKVQLHQSIDRLLGRLDDIQETLVRTNFVLVAGILVHVRRNKDGVALGLRRQRDGTPYLRARALGGIDDFEGRLVDQAMIEGLEPNSNPLALHVTNISQSC